MQPSEMFLYVWSIGATLAATYFYMQAKKLEGHVGVLLQSIADIHDGNAEIRKRGDRITVKYIGDDNGDNTGK